jgi:hypothetical protein
VPAVNESCLIGVGSPRRIRPRALTEYRARRACGGALAAALDALLPFFSLVLPRRRRLRRLPPSSPSRRSNEPLLLLGIPAGTRASHGRAGRQVKRLGVGARIHAAMPPISGLDLAVALPISAPASPCLAHTLDSRFPSPGSRELTRKELLTARIVLVETIILYKAGADLCSAFFT